MLGVIFYEQRSIVTEFGFIEAPLILMLIHHEMTFNIRPQQLISMSYPASQQAGRAS